MGCTDISRKETSPTQGFLDFWGTFSKGSKEDGHVVI
jgi:hypothetical protein